MLYFKHKGIPLDSIRITAGFKIKCMRKCFVRRFLLARELPGDKFCFVIQN